MRIGSSPAVGVLIAVGAGVAVLMALWPLMVASSDAAVFGLAAVALLAVSVLVADWVQVLEARRRRDRRPGARARIRMNRPSERSAVGARLEPDRGDRRCG